MMPLAVAAISESVLRGSCAEAVLLRAIQSDAISSVSLAHTAFIRTIRLAVFVSHILRYRRCLLKHLPILLVYSLTIGFRRIKVLRTCQLIDQLLILYRGLLRDEDIHIDHQVATSVALY